MEDNFTNGFPVYNYVGKYKFDWYENNCFIVSEEANSSENDTSALEYKRIEIGKYIDDNFLVIEMANVNLKDDFSILAFCNKYGLTRSYAKLNDLQPGWAPFYYLGDYEQYSKDFPFYYNDNMTLFEFKKHILAAKHYLKVITEINSWKEALENCNPASMLENLLPILLFQRSHIFDFDDSAPEPITITGRFQKLFLSMLHKHNLDIEGLKLFDLINSITSFLKKKQYELATISSDTSLTSKQVYDKFISQNNCRAQFAYDLGTHYVNCLVDFLYLTLAILEINDCKNVKTTKYGTIKIKSEIKIIPEFVELMYLLAPGIISEMITEELSHLKLGIQYNGNYFEPKSDNFFLYDAMLMDLYITLSKKSIIRKCANPKCDCFFPCIGHHNKIYCSTRCAQLVAKRNQRARDKKRKKPNGPVPETR